MREHDWVGTIDRRRTPLVKAGLIAGLAYPLAASVVVLVLVARAPWFSFIEHAISNLGSWPPTAVYLNTTLVIGGALFGWFAAAMWIRTRTRSRALRASAGFLLASAGMLVLIGRFDEYQQPIHDISALGFFAFQWIAILIVGGWYLHRHRPRRWRDALVNDLFAIVPLITWLFPVVGWCGWTIPELVGFGAFELWLLRFYKQHLRIE